jgi:hypothetical protein
MSLAARCHHHGIVLCFGLVARRSLSHNWGEGVLLWTEGRRCLLAEDSVERTSRIYIVIYG